MKSITGLLIDQFERRTAGHSVTIARCQSQHGDEQRTLDDRIHIRHDSFVQEKKDTLRHEKKTLLFSVEPVDWLPSTNQIDG